MKIYKIHDSMRLAVAAIRDKLQTRPRACPSRPCTRRPTARP